MSFWPLIQLAVSVAFLFLSYALTPKPKTAKPAAATDQDDPTASAGRPIPVVFGTMTVSSPNVIFDGDKAKREYNA